MCPPKLRGPPNLLTELSDKARETMLSAGCFLWSLNAGALVLSGSLDELH